jgi:hypothetical protein
VQKEPPDTEIEAEADDTDDVDAEEADEAAPVDDVLVVDDDELPQALSAKPPAATRTAPATKAGRSM